MSATCLMYWVGSQKRWLKEYRGRSYSVSCRQLHCPPTKEASRRSANDWWLTKQGEINTALGEAKRHPAHIVEHYQAAIENHRLFSKWHRRYGDPAKAEQGEALIEFLNAALNEDDPPYPLPPERQKPIDLMMEVLGEDWLIWQERFAQIQREEKAEVAVPKENTVRGHIDDYLTSAKARYKIGTFNTLQTRLNTFRRWVDPLADIETLNELCRRPSRIEPFWP